MNILETLQRIAILFLLGFPLIMICLIGFLSISVLNVGTIFLFVGQVIIVPILTLVIRIFTSFLPGTHVPPSDVGLLVPSIKDALATSSFNVAPSFWVAHVTFLCSYVFTNAYTVYVVDTKSGPAVSAPKWKLENRRARSLMIMITSVALLIALILSRFLMTGAETVFGIIIALCAFIPAGYFWYQNAIRNGSQNGDIFGIIQQIIPSMENDANASLCIKA
jgi:hypothetical protein